MATNKIRVAYVESEMARRRKGQEQASQLDASNSNLNNPPNDDDDDELTTIQSAANSKLPQRQPASLGKLHEIDLGPDATLRNIARTEAAARRLEGEDIPPEDEETARQKQRKSRLGPDGKPWRGGRKRRNSEDIKRDKLVEEVMRESRRTSSPSIHIYFPSRVLPVLFFDSKTKQKLTPPLLK